MSEHTAENDAPVWRHCRWFDSHPPVPVPGSEGPVRATGGRLGAKCATCGEALTSDVIPPPTNPDSWEWLGMDR
jgi:hypothetical protein